MATAEIPRYTHLLIYLENEFQVLCGATLNMYVFTNPVDETTQTAYEIFNAHFDNCSIVNELVHNLRAIGISDSEEDTKTIIKYLIMKMVNFPRKSNGDFIFTEINEYILNLIRIVTEVLLHQPEILENKSSLDLMLSFLNEIVYSFSSKTIDQYTKTEYISKKKGRVQLSHIYMMEFFKSQIVEMMGVGRCKYFYKINLPYSGDIYDAECRNLYDVKTTINGCDPELTELTTKTDGRKIWRDHDNVDGYYFIEGSNDTHVHLCFTRSNVGRVIKADQYDYSYYELKQNLTLFMSHLKKLNKNIRSIVVLRELDDKCNSEMEGRHVSRILEFFSSANLNNYFQNIKSGFRRIMLGASDVDTSILSCRKIPFVPAIPFGPPLVQLARQDDKVCRERFNRPPEALVAVRTFERPGAHGERSPREEQIYRPPGASGEKRFTLFERPRAHGERPPSHSGPHYVKKIVNEPCIFHSRGYCRKGDNCEYRHDMNEKYFYDKYLKYKAKYMKLKELL